MRYSAAKYFILKIFIMMKVPELVWSCHTSEIYMGEQNVAHPFGWRNDRWLHNVQNVTEGDIYEPIGDSPNSLNRNRRRMKRSIKAAARFEGLIKDTIKGIWRESRSNKNYFQAFQDELKKDDLDKPN